MNIELFSWKTTSNKDHLEVCLPNSRLLSGLIGMWSSMKITIVSHQVRCNSLKHFSDYIDFSFSIQLKVLKAKVSDHTFTNWWQYDNKNYVYYWWNGAFYIESLLDQLKFWKILAVLGFQIEVYLKVDRHLTCLTTHLSGKTSLWYSNKTTLHIF